MSECDNVWLDGRAELRAALPGAALGRRTREPQRWVDSALGDAAHHQHDEGQHDEEAKGRRTVAHTVRASHLCGHTLLDAEY